MALSSQELFAVAFLLSLLVSIGNVAISMSLGGFCYEQRVTAILLGFLTLTPIVGILVMLIIVIKATAILRANGIKVGFLGVDPNYISRA